MESRPLCNTCHVDMQLGDGESGIRLGQEARRLRPHLPVILTSGYSKEEVREAAAESDFLVLPKPFDHVYLGKILAEALQAE